jgi:hypothetical protein
MTHPHPRALEAALRAAISDSDASDLAKRMNGGWSAQAALERAMRDAIPEAIVAYLAALQETHALVPRLPNADMAAAGQWAIQNPVVFPPDNRRIITSQQVWIAMIDAAPPYSPSASGASLPTNDACALPGGVEESRDQYAAPPAAQDPRP